MDDRLLLAKDLKLISAVFDVSSMLKSKPTPGGVRLYYQKTRLAYRLIQSWEGFVHFGISKGNRFRRDDLKEPVRIIDSYVKKTKASMVLELAYGMGANSAYLARMNPDVCFEAIDYSNVPLDIYRGIPNLKFRQGDYHKFAADKRYDLVFIIEGLCHSSNKRAVFRQAFKSLAPGGLLIIFDGYSRRPDSALSRDELMMKRLTEFGMAISSLETPRKLEIYSQAYFKLIEKKDFSERIMPNAKYFHDLARLYLRFPAAAKLMNKLASFEVIKNSLPALLVYDSLCLDVGCYYMHIFQGKLTRA